MAASCRTRRASAGWCRRAGDSRPARRPPCRARSADRRRRSHIRNRRRRCVRKQFSTPSRRITSDPACAPIRRSRPGWRSCVDVGVPERDLEQFLERTRRPFRIGKRVLVRARTRSCSLRHPRPCATSACTQCVCALLAGRERRLRSTSCRDSAIGTMQKKKTSCGFDASASRCRLIFFAGRYCTARSSSIRCSMSRFVTFDRHRHEAQLGRPIVVLRRMQAGPSRSTSPILQDRQRRQQRLDAADGGRPSST